MKTINSQAVKNEILEAIAKRQIETIKRPSKWVYIGSALFILFTGLSAII